MIKFSPVVLAVAALVSASPSVAAPESDARISRAEVARDAENLARALNDPRRQEQIADVFSAVMKAMMQLPVGQIQQAVAKADPNGRMARDIDPDATLGDIASRGDPHFADRMDDNIHNGTRMMGTMGATMAKMAPVLVDMARDMEAQVRRQWKDSERR